MINLRKFVQNMPLNIGTIKRSICIFEEDGVIIFDGAVTGFHCGICGQDKEWDHFHLIKGGKNG